MPEATINSPGAAVLEKPSPRKNGNHLSFWGKVKRDKFLLLIFLPGALYFILFKYLPMFGIIIAFQDYNAFTGIAGIFDVNNFVGLTQFSKLFTSQEFYRILWNTVVLNILSWACGFPFPIIFALVLNEAKGKLFKKTTQTISYLPHFISLVIVAGMVISFLSPSEGFIGQAIKMFTHNPQSLLDSPNAFRVIYIVTRIWTGFGWSAIIYLAALSGVDPQLYEAATIDGATRFQRMLHITIPSLLPTIVVVLILDLGSLMSSEFDLVYLLQTDLNLKSSEVISTFVYKYGIGGTGASTLPQYSYTTAVNLFQSVINLILVVSANTISKKVSEISLW